ncbi:hypothetical protein F5146DRAFT_221107 [Armillaria mellea]|nr:hypothetical protein F5146DRAFT_221107 [Armillaria mellea]
MKHQLGGGVGMVERRSDHAVFLSNARALFPRPGRCRRRSRLVCHLTSCIAVLSAPLPVAARHLHRRRLGNPTVRYSPLSFRIDTTDHSNTSNIQDPPRIDKEPPNINEPPSQRHVDWRKVTSNHSLVASSSCIPVTIFRSSHSPTPLHIIELHIRMGQIETYPTEYLRPPLSLPHSRDTSTSSTRRTVIPTHFELWWSELER